MKLGRRRDDGEAAFIQQADGSDSLNEMLFVFRKNQEHGPAKTFLRFVDAELPSMASAGRAAFFVLDAKGRTEIFTKCDPFESVDQDVFGSQWIWFRVVFWTDRDDIFFGVLDHLARTEHWASGGAGNGCCSMIGRL